MSSSSSSSSSLTSDLLDPLVTLGELRADASTAHGERTSCVGRATRHGQTGMWTEGNLVMGMGIGYTFCLTPFLKCRESTVTIQQWTVIDIVHHNSGRGLVNWCSTYLDSGQRLLLCHGCTNGKNFLVG